jgi:hypothetical protein
MVAITPTDSIAADIGGSIGFAANGTLAGYPTGSIAGRRENATAGNYSSYMQFTTSTSGGSVQERMRIDASGNVGIGVTPSTILHVKSAAPIFRLETIGTVTTGGSAYNSIRDSTGSDVFINGFAGLANCYQFGTIFTNGFMRFLTGNQVEAMRIDSSGNLLVGTTTTFNSGKIASSFDSAANVGIALKQTNANNSGTFLNFAQSGTTIGTITGNATNTAYNTSSDYRLKENVQPMVGALEKVSQLKPVTYAWKVDGSDGQGFIAHELQAIVPHCVTGEKDAVDKDGKPKYQGIDTSFLVATLTAAIQELKAIIDTQQIQINSLLGL